MKSQLKEGAGFPDRLLYTLAVIAGVSVANLYYNQPLLEMIRQDLGTSTLAANHIALFAQCGYALGLLFLIPLADLYSRRRILIADFTLLILALLATAAAPDIRTVHVSSFVIGVCSVVPQFFIPLAAQYSRPERKNRNVGVVLSGLLTGILASRVVSGAVGEWLGWREMYLIAAGLMILSAIAVFRILPDARPNFTGSYGALMRSLLTLVGRYPQLRVHSARAALAFGSFLCFWASLAFKMAGEPFHAGSDIVGLLGLCGVAGAVTATFVGRYIARVGIFRFNCIGAALQLAAWGLFLAGADHYLPIIAGILLLDIGMQCIQLSNQATLFELCPSASNRINTIFMCCYFIGGSFGTLLSGSAWALFGWTGVVGAGALLTLASLAITLFGRRV
ncbi:MFS transporter [uncultured Alistipes sp.]|uniref:MFS transporter n=1 Tax=uncultured Alistipes sp. TaxID=538949 RepID=UPI0028062D78|nr:MFS transporter [uncultured Alistipes sp.]